MEDEKNKNSYYVAFVYPNDMLANKVSERLKSTNIIIKYFNSNEALFQSMENEIPVLIISKLISREINAIKLKFALQEMSPELRPKIIVLTEDSKTIIKIAKNAGITEIYIEPMSYIKMQAIIQSSINNIIEKRKNQEFEMNFEKQNISEKDNDKIVFTDNSKFIDTKMTKHVIKDSNLHLNKNLIGNSKKYNWQTNNNSVNNEKDSEVLNQIETIEKEYTENKHSPITANKTDKYIDKFDQKENVYKINPEKAIDKKVDNKKNLSESNISRSHTLTKNQNIDKNIDPGSKEKNSSPDKKSNFYQDPNLSKKNSPEESSDSSSEAINEESEDENFSFLNRFNQFKEDPLSNTASDESFLEKRSKPFDIRIFINGSDFIISNNKPLDVLENILDNLKDELESSNAILIKLKNDSSYEIYSSDSSEAHFDEKKIENIRKIINTKKYFIETVDNDRTTSNLIFPVSDNSCFYFEKNKIEFTEFEITTIERVYRGFKNLIELIVKS